MGVVDRVLPPLPALPWCGCLSRISPAAAIGDVFDESVELLKEPSLDELSDVFFGLGRLLGALTGSPYRRVPFAGRHIDKVVARMTDHGCVRSPRHLVDGRCPSA